MDDALDRVAAALSGWTPLRVRAATREIDWALLDEPIAEPFFEQTAGRAMRHPFNAAFARRTPVAVLDAFDRGAPGPAPAGFIFHMSRCGSTLIAQMLAQPGSSVVLSEAQPVDALLRLRRDGVDDDTVTRSLRGLLSAFAHAHGGEPQLFVKFHAWHVLELPFIMRAFPNVPWIFVFREPRAVLASHARITGAEVVAGAIDPAYAGLDARSVQRCADDEYTARVLAAFCNAALRAGGIGRFAFVDYRALPGIVLTELLEFFSVRMGSQDAGRMREVARLDSKSSGVTFATRPEERGGSAAIDRLAARWLDEPYRALRARALTWS